MSIVLFDKDGVIVDSEPTYLKRNKAFLNHLGVEVSDDDLKCLAGSNPRRDLAFYRKWLGDKFDKDDFQKERKTFFDKCKIDFLSLKMPNLDITLQSLRNKGHHMSLVSSSGKEMINRIVNLFDISQYFDYLISGDDFKEAKPNPEIYLYAMSKYKNINEKIYVIEDSTLGIEAAKGARLTVIAKKDDRFNYDQSKADYLINDLVEILDIVK